MSIHFGQTATLARKIMAQYFDGMLDVSFTVISSLTRLNFHGSCTNHIFPSICGNEFLGNRNTSSAYYRNVNGQYFRVYENELILDNKESDNMRIESLAWKLHFEKFIAFRLYVPT